MGIITNKIYVTISLSEHVSGMTSIMKMRDLVLVLVWYTHITINLATLQDEGEETKDSTIYIPIEEWNA
jgi:hypothetical protein